QAVDPELFRSAVIALGLGYTVQHSAMLLARSREGTQRTDEEFVDHACQLLLDSHGGGGELRCA
ncbi:MAG TPA: hypothetical protein VFI53_13645, partial [Myxococcaceae bacterium]|nr:hypothetical protein [Myxococcaceae bacterium]